MTSTGSRADPIVIYPSRGKAAVLFVLAVAFVVAGVWIWTLGQAGRVAEWKALLAAGTAIPFFGLAGAYIGYRLIWRSPALTIDASGLTDSASAVSAGHLAWDEIECVVPYDFSGQMMLGVIPRDLDALLERQSTFRKRMMKMNLGMGAAPVNIPQGILPMTAVELADLLQTEYGVQVGDAF